ncbi:MAG: glycosyltransferase [Pseudomonadota bacterium]
MNGLVSVVIPTRDRPGPLACCLRALVEQVTSSPTFEVIIVDDGGHVDLAAVAAPYRSRMRVQVLRQQPGGPARARNLGAAKASGQFLAFTDDDCAPHPDWLLQLQRALENAPRAMVGGVVINALVDNSWSEASQVLVDHLVQYYNQVPGQARFLTSNNIALSRQQWLELGGFDETFPHAAAEDRDLCARWVEKGRPLLFVPEARVDHFHHLDATGYLRQHFNYGRGAARFHRLRRHRGGPVLQLEPLTFYLDLLRGPVRDVSFGVTARRVVVLAMSQLANAAGFATESLVQRGSSSSPGADAGHA